jgi:hypothetical protein
MTGRARIAAAVGCLAVMTGAHVAPLVHLALVPHVTCAVHGELIHGDTHEASAPAPDEVAFIVGNGESDAHEHCWSLTAQRTATRPQVALISDAVRPCVEAVGCALPQRPSLEVLAVAPKASPPV